MENIKVPPERGYQKTVVLLLTALALRVFFLFLTENTGTDSWARYTASLLWAQHPDHLPSDVWLPLPFWILGAVLRFFPSEPAARTFTLLVGAATILPFYGIAKRVCSPRGAFYSSLVYAFLGLHIAYSVSTSSESLTLFFLIGGTYYWLRFRTESKSKWFLISVIALNAAALCRYEVWVLLPVFAVLTMLDPGMAADNFTQSKRLGNGVLFGLAASVASVAWSLYSLRKWNDPLAQAHLTASLNAHRPSELEVGTLHKVLAVPGDLLGSLGPVILVIAIIGIGKALSRRNSLRWDLAVVAAVLAGFHAFNGVVNGATMARYTLMYSWLWITLAFYGLDVIGATRTRAFQRAVLVFTVTSFVLWQFALVVGAQYAPCRIADKLGSVAATVPLRCDLRQTISWLDQHLSATDSVIVDDFQYESTSLIRFSKVNHLKYFRSPYMAADTNSLLSELADFVQANHPRILVYSPKGQLGRIWKLPAGEVPEAVSGLNGQLHQVWQNDDYRVYQIAYSPQASLGSTSANRFSKAVDAPSAEK